MTVYLLRRGPQLLHEPLPRHWPCAIGLSHSPILVLPASEEVGGACTLYKGHLSVHVCVQVGVCTWWLLILLWERELNSEPGTCSRARVLPCPSTWSTKALAHGLPCAQSQHRLGEVSQHSFSTLYGVGRGPTRPCGPTQLTAA